MLEGIRMESGNYFDEVAPQWDRLRESFFSKAVRDKAFAVANLQEGRIAADIGCGTGFITEGLVQRGLSVIAVDGSQNMLSEMKQKFAGLDLIDYRLGEAGFCQSRTKKWTMLSPICICIMSRFLQKRSERWPGS